MESRFHIKVLNVILETTRYAGEGNIFKCGIGDAFWPLFGGERGQKLGQTDCGVLGQTVASEEQIFIATLVESLSEAGGRQHQPMVLFCKCKFALHHQRAAILENKVVILL